MKEIKKNIHFTNRELYEVLTENIITEGLVGSHLYGLENSNSDKDYLIIYKENNNSFIQSHHQLQYKVEKVDYNFTSLNTFINNIINGDATINFEVLYSSILEGTDLDWLIEYREEFVTYNLIKSYLGLAKRDLKRLNRIKDVQEYNKKLSHIYRGIMYADMLINHKFTLEKIDLLERIKNSKSKFKIEEDLEKRMLNLRELNNRNLEDKKISRYPSAKVLNDIETKCAFLQKGTPYIDYGSLFVEAFTDGITY